MSEVRELLEQLRLEDLEGKSCYHLAEVIGMDAFRRLVLVFGGSEPYVPEAKKLILPIRNILINREFDGSNDFNLASKWGLSERYVRTLAKDKVQEIKKERKKPIQGQIRFF